MNSAFESLYICDFSFVSDIEENLEFYKRIFSSMDDHLIRKFSKEFLFFISLVISLLFYNKKKC